MKTKVRARGNRLELWRILGEGCAGAGAKSSVTVSFMTAPRR